MQGSILNAVTEVNGHFICFYFGLKGTKTDLYLYKYKGVCLFGVFAV